MSAPEQLPVNIQAALAALEVEKNALNKAEEAAGETAAIDKFPEFAKKQRQRLELIKQQKKELEEQIRQLQEKQAEEEDRLLKEATTAHLQGDSQVVFIF